MLDDPQAIVALCRDKLDLANARSTEQPYASLPLCVVDTVFSIGAHATSTANTVQRFAEHLGLPLYAATPPSRAAQFSITKLLNLYTQHTAEHLAQEVFGNLQRTSTRNGILKAEAVRRFAEVVREHGANYLQDVPKIQADPAFERAIQRIPGQKSGISLRYFYILTGSTDYVKPDRMIIRFIATATGKDLSVDKAHSALVHACRLLQREHPHLTPVLLDSLIWHYQREQDPES